MTLSEFVATRRWTDDIAAAAGIEGMVPDGPGYVYECDGLAWIAATDDDDEYTAALFGGGQCHGTLAECEEAVFASLVAFREDEAGATPDPFTLSERRLIAAHWAARWVS